jgi:HK97 family phage portal protein
MGQPRFTVIGGKVVPVGDDLESNITEGYESIGTIYSIIKIMTNKGASIPGYLYSGSKESTKKAINYKQYSPQGDVRHRAMLVKEMREITEHPFLQLLKKPNAYQTQSDFIKQVLGYRLITGNCYIRKNCGQQPGVDPGSSKPVELNILPAQYIDIIGDPREPNTVLGYKLNGGGVQVTFHANEIIHFKYPNYSFDGMTLEHLYGMSPLKALTNDITAAKYMKRAQASQAQNEGAKGMIVRNDDYELTEEQRDAVQSRVDAEIGGAKNRGRAIVTNANVRWEQIGLSASEMDLVKTFQLSKEDLCNAFNGFPPFLLTTVSSTFNNLNAAVKFLTTNCVWPEMVDLQDMFTKDLLHRYWGEELAYMHDVSDLPELAEDYNLMSQSLKDLYWLTLNEKRAVMKWGKLPDPNMDEIIVPSGYIPLERVFEDPFAADMNQAPPDYNNGAEGK